MPDERLALMFACAHPAIDPGMRAPLILQTILGFDAATIASAFLVSPATMGQRLVRAKTKIRQAGIPFRVPERAELRERLDAVLEAIYAAFAEGWSDPAGTEARRRNLGEEAIWLGRLVVSLLPDEPEALGLLALMLHAEARRGARRDAAGDYVPLAEQDPALWDAELIDEAEALLLRGEPRWARSAATSSRRRCSRPMRCAAHRRGRLGGDRALYDALAAITGSPVVAINRAVAMAETDGPAAGLAALDALAGDARLAQYQPYWAARAALLAAAGRHRSGRRGLRAGDRPRSRPGGAALPAAAARGDAAKLMQAHPSPSSGREGGVREARQRAKKEPHPALPEEDREKKVGKKAFTATPPPCARRRSARGCACRCWRGRRCRCSRGRRSRRCWSGSRSCSGPCRRP